MLFRDSLMNSANGAFGRHERHDSDGKKPRADGAKFATARPQISGVGGQHPREVLRDICAENRKSKSRFWSSNGFDHTRNIGSATELRVAP
jgi:hypothetical protein